MAWNFDKLVEAVDLNGLLRAVDSLCAAREWDELVDLADRCEDALERGKQLWPIAAHIDYRLALEAPGDYAAMVLHPESSRFGLGPLTEVAASRHTWEELAPHIEGPQVAAYVAQERVLRGEDLSGDERAHPEVLHLPLRLEPWEPAYAVATFGSNYLEVDEPWEPRAPLREATVRPGPTIDDPELEDALLDLVQPWTAESNGAARAAVVEGDSTAAASTLTYDRLRRGDLELEEALRLLGWAAASGGARGRRRGGAAGRFHAWYATSLAGGLGWPVEPAELGARAAELGWSRWDEGEAEPGWVLRVAIEEPREGWAAALAATDLLEEDEDSD